jgi:hypothetical protein
MEGQRRGSEPGEATWDGLYMTDPRGDVTITVSSCATGWNGNSYLPRCPSVSRPDAGHLLGIRLGALAAPVIPSAQAHVEEGGAKKNFFSK